MYSNIMTNTRFFICAAGVSLLLTGCGGAGGGSASSSGGSAVTSFKNLSIPTTFTWTSQQVAISSSVTLNNASGSLGNIRVTVSNFIVTDPTGSGAAIPAMSTDVLISALGSGLLSSAAISFGQLSIPSGTQQVMVEVFSTDNGSRLGGGIVNVSSLLAGTATLAL